MASIVLTIILSVVGLLITYQSKCYFHLCHHTPPKFVWLRFASLHMTMHILNVDGCKDWSVAIGEDRLLLAYIQLVLLQIGHLPRIPNWYEDSWFLLNKKEQFNTFYQKQEKYFYSDLGLYRTCPEMFVLRFLFLPKWYL